MARHFSLIDLLNFQRNLYDQKSMATRIHCILSQNIHFALRSVTCLLGRSDFQIPLTVPVDTSCTSWVSKTSPKTNPQPFQVFLPQFPRKGYHHSKVPRDRTPYHLTSPLHSPITVYLSPPVKRARPKSKFLPAVLYLEKQRQS